MKPNTNLSFIPKSPIKTTASHRVNRGSGKGIIFLITLIIFVGVVLFSVGLFLYQQFLLQNIEEKSAQLERAKTKFDSELIKEIGRLDVRIQSIRDILSNHRTFSSFFNLLESITLQNVQFEKLSYSTDDTGQTNVTMKGRAASFNSVALQSDMFNDNTFIQDPMFSNINLDKRGDVVFDLDIFVDTELLLYKGNVMDTTSVESIIDSTSEGFNTGIAEEAIGAEVDADDTDSIPDISEDSGDTVSQEEPFET